MPARVSNRTKVLRGTLRHDRQKRKTPKPRAGIPQKPSHLTFGASKEWDKLTPRLESMRVVTEADEHALELLCEALAEYRRALAILEKEGLTYKTETARGSIMERARPENAIAADAWRRAKMMLSNFGLDPASRGRVETVRNPKVNEFDEFGPSLLD